MQSNQIHTCHVGVCLSYYGWEALLKCKWWAPWPLSNNDVVDQKGNWWIQWTYSYVNNYHPNLLVALWCNQDIKLLTNGEDTKHLTWYISNYTTKGQKAVYNMSLLIAKYVAYHFSDSLGVFNAWECTWNLLFQCLHATNCNTEQPGPQVVSYLMGWGDRYLSHQFYLCLCIGVVWRAIWFAGFLIWIRTSECMWNI